MDGFKLAEGLAERMGEIAPPGVTVAVDGDMLWFDCHREDGEHHRSGTYACQWLNEGDASDDRLTRTCWHALEDFREFVDEVATSRPWPAVWPIEPGSAIAGGSLLIWYEGEGGRHLLDMTPIPLDTESGS